MSEATNQILNKDLYGQPAIPAIEKILGAPLSERNKQFIEQMLVMTFVEGVSVGAQCMQLGRQIASNVFALGSDKASEKFCEALAGANDS